MKDHFRSVSAYPEREDANGIVMRLIDGLGFRFYWATEGLTEDDYAFSPGHGCMSIGELIGHVWGLVNWIHLNVLGKGLDGGRPQEPGSQRDQVFQMLYRIRSQVSESGEKSLFELEIDGDPCWHMINGPISDALTHTGQINAFRRLGGNVVPKHSVFTCQ